MLVKTRKNAKAMKMKRAGGFVGFGVKSDLLRNYQYINHAKGHNC